MNRIKCICLVWTILLTAAQAETLAGVKSPVDHATLPECVHWAGAYYPEDIVDHALVTGNQGMRLYMHPENPELCQTPDVGDCKGRAYVIPGDHVFIGNTCGRWAYVWFPIKNRPRASGWVEVSRLTINLPDTKIIADRETRRKIMSGLFLPPTDDPFFQAIRKNDLVAVEQMLSSDAAFRTTKECEAVAYNALYSDLRILQALTKGGLDPNCSSRFHPSPLMRLAEVDRGVASNWINELPDPAAAARNWVAAGANVNAKDEFGKNALRLTISRNNVDIARVLLDSGADANSYHDEMSVGTSTALMDAIDSYSQTWDSSMVRLLLEHGVDVNYNNNSHPAGSSFDCPSITTAGPCEFAGQTALTGATEDGYYTIVKLLLEHGADPTMPRDNGKTALEIAIEKKNERIAKLIRYAIRAIRPTKQPNESRL